MTIKQTVGLALATASTLGFFLATAPAGKAALSDDAAAPSAKNVSRWVSAAQKVGAAENSRDGVAV